MKAGSTPIPHSPENWFSRVKIILILIVGLSPIVAPLKAAPIPTSLEYIPIPNSLVGYRNWSGPTPTLRLEIKPKTLVRLRKGSSVILKINALEAQDMKLSDRPDFKGVPWQAVKEEQPWILRVRDNQTIYTVYAVFRYQHPQTKQRLISPIIHDSLNLNAPHKKITRTQTGYFDWYDLTLNLETHSPPSSAILENAGNPNKITEVNFIKLQDQAEEQSRQNAYRMVQRIPILRDYSLQDFLILNQWLLPDLRNSVYSMRLTKVYYPTPESIFLEQTYSLLGNQGSQSDRSPTPTPKPIRNNENTAPLIYNQVIKNLYNQTPLPIQSVSTDREVSALIIDTRGTTWSPVLLAEVIDNQGRTLLTPNDYFKSPSSPNRPYLRYLRDLENVGDWEMPDQALVVKALQITPKDNQIMILEQYGKLLRTSEKQVQTLIDGNFLIVTD